MWLTVAPQHQKPTLYLCLCDVGADHTFSSIKLLKSLFCYKLKKGNYAEKEDSIGLCPKTLALLPFNDL